MQLARPRNRQPQWAARIDERHPLGSAIIDAFLPGQLLVCSARGRKPTVIPSGGIGLQAGKFGIGAYGISGSVRYDVGSFAQSGTFAFMTVALFRRYSATCSVVRRDGAFIPCQVANSTVRSVGWNPVSPLLNYYSSPAGDKANVLITNRESQSTERLYVDGILTASNTGFSGYGSTSNPLCFLGTEANAEIFTSADGLFFLGVPFNRALTIAEIRSLSANPRQIIAPRRLILGSVATVQTARPIADLSNTGWVPSSGADLYPMVGETVRDDGTYIAATAVGAICELDLADLADPAVSTGHLPTLVLSAPGGGGITVRLRQGTTTIATWTYHPGATPTEYTPALSGAEADSITDYTALRLQFEAIA
jgi:hypothetical protein